MLNTLYNPPTNQHIAAARKVYETYWDSYMNGDLETFTSTLADNYEMIGTSESEVAHNKAEGIAFFKSQMQEMAGKAEMRNRQISAKPVNEMLLINENCDIFVLAGTGWAFYSKIRISTFLHETPSGWKVVQQHGSLPDMRVQEGETLAIDKISRENVELRDAVKDNGDGIPHHVLNKIFQPFFTTKPTGQGTGLALSLSYDIVSSTSGTVFKIILGNNHG